jgi:hypothetical protein
MGLNDKANKIRRAAERPSDQRDERRKSDVEHAETYAELTQSDHSKGRPSPDRPSGRRPSNAGQDGP